MSFDGLWCSIAFLVLILMFCAGGDAHTFCLPGSSVVL